jgi:purine-binding chemotaxis protein CheW
MDKRPGQEAASVRYYCTFRLGGYLFGCDLLHVKEVNTQTTFTPIPHAPAVVCGYVNLRGHIFLVLDTRQLLGMEAATLTPDSRLLIFKAGVGGSFGVLVDRIGDIVTLTPDEIESQPLEDRPELEPMGATRAGTLVAGIGKLEGELIVLLRPEQFLTDLAGRLAGDFEDLSVQARLSGTNR